MSSSESPPINLLNYQPRPLVNNLWALVNQLCNMNLQHWTFDSEKACASKIFSKKSQRIWLQFSRRFGTLMIFRKFITMVFDCKCHAINYQRTSHLSIRPTPIVVPTETCVATHMIILTLNVIFWKICQKGKNIIDTIQLEHNQYLPSRDRPGGYYWIVRSNICTNLKRSSPSLWSLAGA